MISKQAQEFWRLLKSAPKQIQLPIDQRREAGEHAEDRPQNPLELLSRLHPMLTAFGPNLPIHRSDEPFSIYLVADICSRFRLRAEKPPVTSPSLRRRAC